MGAPNIPRQRRSKLSLLRSIRSYFDRLERRPVPQSGQKVYFWSRTLRQYQTARQLEHCSLARLNKLSTNVLGRRLPKPAQTRQVNMERSEKPLKSGLYRFE
jgi:hypothetical protein